MHLKLLIVVATIAILGTASAQEAPQNCISSCGNVTIPYPFGSGEGCYRSRDFLVTCDGSSGEPIPYFGQNTSNLVVSNISISKGEVEIMGFVGRDCYNSAGRVGRTRTFLRLGRLTEFRVSTKNRFVAIGCDTYAVFRGGRRNESNIGTGCISTCGRDNVIKNGSCSGVGCCEVAVPERVNSFNLTLRSWNNHSNILDFNPCSYSFLVEEGKFNFSTTNLLDFGSVRKMPMLLDWAIGNQTCDQAKDMDDFLCKGNSTCDQDYEGPGYRCRCREGYEGNPYVVDANGCKNINECERGNHDCEHDALCVDSLGNYTCKCREGYSGDGRKDGTGCTADESTVLKIGLGISISAIFLLIFVTWLYLILKKRKLMMLREIF